MPADPNTLSVSPGLVAGANHVARFYIPAWVGESLRRRYQKPRSWLQGGLHPGDGKKVPRWRSRAAVGLRQG